MKLTKHAWGLTHEGRQAYRYVLENDHGMTVELSDFGALILAIRLPVGGGERDVVLGYDTMEEYYSNGAGFGAYIGRNGNRIGGAKVTLEGVCYELERNNNGNNLHSGSDRSCYKLYSAESGEDAEGVYLSLSRVSPHMEQGFPGNLEQTIRYTLTPDNTLKIHYRMVSDRETVINPTNHCYFNLAGHSGGSITEHTLTLLSEAFLPTDNELIPTGEVRSVEGTPFDFRTPCKVGARIDDDYEPLNQAGGYDHNYCFPNDGAYRKVAAITCPEGALTMEVYSDLCGMQVYTGNFLGGDKGKDGAVYHRRNGICFETQGYPNACNTPSFPATVYPAGKVFDSTTAYRFVW